MKEKKGIWFKIGGALIAFSVLMFMLNNQIQDTNQHTETAKGSKNNVSVNVKGKMDIAIVNEDEGTVIDNTAYDLGSNYIKQIEKNEDYDWYVVSRGSAETGLNEGSYQLMLVIPNNFSAKILDLNDTNPEKVAVQYRVNANGNGDLEAEANRVGQEIVNGLNQQLVDVYVATILVNLSQAQNNVQEVVNGNNNNMFSYEDQVYGTALNFEYAIPTIKAHTDTSLQGNERLTNTLIENTEGFTEYSRTLMEYDSHIMEYIASLDSDASSYASFMEQLISMDANLLNAETQNLFQSIQLSNSQLLAQFQQPSGPSMLAEKRIDTYASEFARLQKYMDEMNTKITQQEELLDHQLASVNTFVEKQMMGYYKTNGAISLKDFLSLHENDRETNALLKEIKTNEALHQQNVLDNIAALPYFAINGETNAQLTLIKKEETKQFIESVNKQTSYLESFKTTPNKEAKALKQRVADSYAALSPFVNNKEEKTFSFEIDNSNGTIEPDSIITVNFPEGVTGTWAKDNQVVDGKEVIIVNGSYKIDSLPENHAAKQQITVELLQEQKEPTPIYGEPEQTDIGDKSDTESSSENNLESVSEDSNPESNEAEETPAAEEIELNKPIIGWVEGRAGVHYVFYEEIDYYSDLAGMDYRKALNDYSEVMGEVKQLYQDVFDQIGITPNKVTAPIFNAYSTTAEEFLNRDVRTYLTDIVTYTLTANLTNYHTLASQQINARATINNLTEQVPVLTNKLVDIRTAAQNNSEQIEAQLQLLSNWQEQIQNLTVLGAESAVDQETSSATAKDIHSQLGQLLQSSGSLMSNSENTVELANSVADVFKDFDKDVSVLALSSEELSSDATSLMSQFQEQIQENNDFAGGFVELLKNTHSNGVLNETVMDFIANPVEQDFKGSVQTAKTVNPFSWILMAYGISLFAGYLVATNNLVFLKKDDFDESNAALKLKAYPLLIVVGLSTILGVIEGIVSGNVLAVPFDYMLQWTLLITLISIVFTLLNYGLIKLWKNIGLGISIYFLIGYVFVTEMIGTTANLSGFAQVVRNANPLMLGERALRTVLSVQSGVGYVTGLSAFAITLVALLLMIKQRTPKQEVV
ncbi:type VII secretion protein EsaA [Desemzia sp. RIT804]|uniref:type VII secretion protein EsaA n=1 Tax=Desemzia sp. RIT 804 TaxID=2810209 RepID=UPI0019523B3E|nr:type VII secretion protein EsaA [Desemzia sp. RIT 804]MBM6614789.1 type VII secretion protein EsaA [Desemzia sp. RIT 804]